MLRMAVLRRLGATAELAKSFCCAIWVEQRIAALGYRSVLIRLGSSNGASKLQNGTEENSVYRTSVTRTGTGTW